MSCTAVHLELEFESDLSPVKSYLVYLIPQLVTPFRKFRKIREKVLGRDVGDWEESF